MNLLGLPGRHLLIVFASASLWIPGFTGMYFLSDDFTHLEIWGTTSWESILQWFGQEYTGFYRPLTALLWKLYHSLWGMTPLGYHVSNLVLHSACTMMVGAATSTMFRNSRAGLVAALIFMFQPGHVFGVLMIANLTGLLCTFFVLAALVSYLYSRQGSTVARIVSVSAFAAGLLTKELAICLPMVVAAWESILLHIENCESRPLRLWAQRVCPYVLLLAAYVVFRYMIFGQLSHSPLGHSNLDPINLALNFTAYVSSSLSPWGLESLKPEARAHPVLIGTLGLLGGMFVVMATWKWRKRLHGGHLMSATLLLVSVIPVLRLFSPWNAYLPTAGSAALLGGLLGGTTVSRRIRINLRSIVAAVMILLGIGYSLTHQRQWVHAGNAVRTLLKEAETNLCNREGRFYLANLPVEIGSVPVFGGDWALLSALKLRGCGAEILPLTTVHHEQPDLSVKFSVTDGYLKLKLSDHEFFRLSTLEVLSKKVVPKVGYQYTKYGFRVQVASIGAQNKPDELSLVLGDGIDRNRVITWQGNKFASIGTKL